MRENGSGNDAVATIARAKISSEAFKTLLRNELTELRCSVLLHIDYGHHQVVSYGVFLWAIPSPLSNLLDDLLNMRAVKWHGT